MKRKSLSRILLMMLPAIATIGTIAQQPDKPGYSDLKAFKGTTNTLQITSLPKDTTLYTVISSTSYNLSSKKDISGNQEIISNRAFVTDYKVKAVQRVMEDSFGEQDADRLAGLQSATRTFTSSLTDITDQPEIYEQDATKSEQLRLVTRMFTSSLTAISDPVL